MKLEKLSFAEIGAALTMIFDFAKQNRDYDFC